MSGYRRPTRRDWLAGLLAGAVLGTLLLGIGGRGGMRVIALAMGQPTGFSLGGTLTVVFLGACTGVLFAVAFLLARVLFPGRRWIRATLFWAVCLALSLRGLRPVTALNASIFLPLIVVYGALLHAFWCRVYVRRMNNRHPERSEGSRFFDRFAISE